jgi:hypothetical protein
MSGENFLNRKPRRAAAWRRLVAALVICEHFHAGAERFGGDQEDAIAVRDEFAIAASAVKRVGKPSEEMTLSEPKVRATQGRLRVDGKRMEALDVVVALH